MHQQRLIIDDVPQFFDLDRARQIAATLQLGDEDWSYTARPIGQTGQATVMVRDEDDKLVGYWSNRS
jgi:hypothetical protein